MPRFLSLLVIALCSFALLACSGTNGDGVESALTSALNSHKALVKENNFSTADFLAELSPLADAYHKAAGESKDGELKVSPAVHEEHLRAIQDFSNAALEAGNAAASAALNQILAKKLGR